VQQREAEHVDEPGTDPESGDQHHRRPHRRGRHRGGEQDARPEHRAGEHLLLGQAPLQERHREHPHGDTHPEPEGQQAEAGLAPVEHLVGEHRSQGHEHAAADQAGGQAHDDGAGGGVHERELPALLQVGEHRTELDALGVGPVALRSPRDRQGRDDERGDEEGEPIDVERQAFLVQAQSIEPTHVGQELGDPGEDGEQARPDGKVP
jgi:hypothetical protein